MQRGDQRSPQGQMGDDQQDCGTIDSWYGHGSRSLGCVLTDIHDLFFQQVLVYSDFQSVH